MNDTKPAIRRLLLLRHGKSDWNAEFASDHERPLAKRGRRASDTIGRWVAKTGHVPQLALTSTAVRARDTLARAIDAGGWEVEVRELPALYMAAADDVLSLVRELDEDPSTLLVAGHQPTLSNVVALAVGGGAARMPTCGLSCLRLASGSWRHARPGAFELEWHVNPRLLAAGS